MVKYDPENPLSDKELDELAEKDFEMFLEYLDEKTAYLKKFTKPLDAYHLKRFASQAKKDSTGESLTTEEIKELQKLGEKNEAESFDEEKHKEWIDKKHHMLKSGSLGVKNIKTHRSQWFD
jgi:hypothetical protein